MAPIVLLCIGLILLLGLTLIIMAMNTPSPLSVLVVRRQTKVMELVMPVSILALICTFFPPQATIMGHWYDWASLIILMAPFIYVMRLTLRRLEAGPPHPPG
jgi:cytochrome bd-type quinol oxidase subunit 2